MPERIKLKVCGMKDSANMQVVAQLRPDYLGLIFYPPSPRYVGGLPPETLPDLSGITKVGVFVNETTEVIRQTSKKFDFKHVQLHGKETPEQCAQIRSLGFTIIKVFSIGKDFDFTPLNNYTQVADYFLFDTKGKHHGGNGLAFDWSMLRGYDNALPVFLSGGIGPENVEQVQKLDFLNLYAIDINSQVEITPGLKDIQKIRLLQRKLVG